MFPSGNPPRARGGRSAARADATPRWPDDDARCAIEPDAMRSRSAASPRPDGDDPEPRADDAALPDALRAPPHDPAVLHHDADLLRQRRPAPRPRLHDDGRRRARPVPPHARRRHPVPDRHRRARPEGRGGREQARADPAAARRSGRAAVRRDLEDARHRGLPLHPHDDRKPQAGGRRRCGSRIRERNPDDLYLASYQGWYCVGCEAFYTESQLAEGRRRLGVRRSTRSRWPGSTRSAAGSSGCRGTPSRCSATSRPTPSSSGPRPTATRSSRSCAAACAICRCRAPASRGASRSPRPTPTGSTT